MYLFGSWIFLLTFPAVAIFSEQSEATLWHPVSCRAEVKGDDLDSALTNPARGEGKKTTHTHTL